MLSLLSSRRLETHRLQGEKERRRRKGRTLNVNGLLFFLSRGEGKKGCRTLSSISEDSSDASSSFSSPPPLLHLSDKTTRFIFGVQVSSSHVALVPLRRLSSCADLCVRARTAFKNHLSLPLSLFLPSPLLPPPPFILILLLLLNSSSFFLQALPSSPALPLSFFLFFFEKRCKKWGSGDGD